MQGFVKGKRENSVLRKEATLYFTPAVFMLEKAQISGRTAGRDCTCRYDSLPAKLTSWRSFQQDKSLGGACVDRIPNTFNATCPATPDHFKRSHLSQQVITKNHLMKRQLGIHTPSFSTC